MSEDDDPIRVTDALRVSLARVLERWLDECERTAAEQYGYGRGGYIGELKLSASTEDDTITVSVERTILEPLP